MLALITTIYKLQVFQYVSPVLIIHNKVSFCNTFLNCTCIGTWVLKVPKVKTFVLH